MKSASILARDDVKWLAPCIHGGEVWDIANAAGIRVQDLVDFSSSINPLGPSPLALKAITDDFPNLSLYPDSNSTGLRKAIAKHFGNISEDNIIIGNGSTELIYLFAEVFLNKGDTALVVAPSFGEYACAITKNGGKAKYINVNQDFQIDSKTFNQEMQDAKAIFLCNPNNPTSMLIPDEPLREIVETALKREILVFLDEDFIEFVEGSKRHSLVGFIGKYPNVFVLRTFTKFYGLTGLRVGYGIADKKTIDVFFRAKMPWNVNSLAQAAAIASLTDSEHSRSSLKIVKVEKEFLTSELTKIKGFKVFPADTNFIFIDIRDSGFSAAQLRERMIAQGILLRDCSSFAGLDGHYVRIAVRIHEDNERLLNALKEVL
ncbi:MAG TPA: threonine-phosphate decarboxylase CobD [Candidatus Sulfotelmatobacter sp.]|nr:threonine-phosphate decarboxylase CobD [Candidatus Sulfotelmatobacter sp.]